MVRENSLQKNSIKKAKKADVLAYKVISPGRRGFPDVLLVFKGEEKVEYIKYSKLKEILESGK